MDQREERAARNEMLARDVNERIEGVAQEFAYQRQEKAGFSCECGRADCTQIVYLTIEEYEAVRRHGARFLVTGGHEMLDVERVVEEHPTYLVIEKTGDAKPFVEGRDPRS